MSDIKYFGEKVHKRRKELRMTLKELGEKIGSTKSYVWELENKAVARPSAKTLFNISDILNVSPEYLFYDDIDNQKETLREKVLIRKFNQLGEKDKSRAEQLIEIWIKE